MEFQFENLSFWEKQWLINDIDFIVTGAGIVGLSSAFHLKKKHPKAKILILDKGVLPFSASSKNAGFACFGSPTELLADLSTMAEEKVWNTVKMRWEGLLALKNWLGETEIDLQTLGSWDLIHQKTEADEIRDQLTKLNNSLFEITGEKSTFSEDKTALNRFGFEQITAAFNNNLEGQLNTSLLIQTALKKVQKLGITILRGVELKSFQTLNSHVVLVTNFGELKTDNLVICTNGFTAQFYPEFDLKPARAQVLITKEISDLKPIGTFHIDRGYYYFRNIGKRLLIGGGRNINFKKEQTVNFQTTEEIQSAIEEKLRQIILPKTPFEIDHRWSGIMGVGQNKEPIIERINERVCIGIRMGGMGVAIGTLVGQKLAHLNS